MRDRKRSDGESALRARKSGRNPAGAALLITLLILSLMTIIVVAFLGTMTWEMSSARIGYENQKARAMALLGMNTAVAQLRLGLDSWDNPYGNFATNPPLFFWSISPGLLTRWSYASATPSTTFPLFSTGSTNLVNLNAETSDQSYPIAGITTNITDGSSHVPNISVYWANVLENPANAAGAVNPDGTTNAIVGRYAFWVDDENAKINLNTADGTMKYTTNSLGIGSPSEVSLQVLQTDPTSLTPATNIVYLARTTGFNSIKEILRATNATLSLYTNNVFNLTAYSRSPDLNIFGQPKMALMPILGDLYGGSSFGTNMAMNGITLQPPREIYPTPSQLPPYYVIGQTGNPYSTWFPNPPNTTATAEPWPLAFRAEGGPYNSGNLNTLNPGDGGSQYTLGNYPWINGMMLANYLAGTNAAGQPIRWPLFSGLGPTTTGFAGKYTARQLDSIVAQILSLGSKDISPDLDFVTGGDYDTIGSRAYVSPFLFHGWLSHQWVSGMGRAPKVTALKVSVTAYGSVGSINDAYLPYQPAYTNYTAPQAQMDIWMQWWLPAAYLGGKNIIPISGAAAGNMNLGVAIDRGVLNLMDLTMNGSILPNPGGVMPRNSAATITNWWGNQLLTNNQGIDFQCNPTSTNDPDQASAQLYHPYEIINTNGMTPPNVYTGAGTALGNGVNFDPPFLMNAMQGPYPSMLGPYPSQDWAPGELRCVRSEVGSLITMPMQANAGVGANTNLVIGGGMQVRGEFIANTSTDPDPVPLDAMRGASPWNYLNSGEMADNEQWSDPGTTAAGPLVLRDRYTNEVIPIQLTVPIPAPNGGAGTNVSVVMSVADPLVNKFPGDWTNTPGAALAYWGAGTDNTTNSEYLQGGAFHNALQDPDSYWLPQADCAYSRLTDVPSQTLIPRSARFPNIGYLQYVRTGIMPDVDNPTQPSLEHGTPFRLLSFGPLNDGSQTVQSGNYPDWAMLDLLYVPSILSAYRSPYGYYDVNTNWQGFGNPGVLANYSTGGGSTPGRINPNGMVIYTTNTAIPQPDVFRTLPMQAVLQGVMVNQHLVQTTDPYNDPFPGFTGGSTVNARSVAQAIATYISTNGPLRMPGELCDVTEIANLRPGASISVTRNDLIRQIIGNLTTQSNTFSVWVAGQAVMKSKANNIPANQGIYEPGDEISASVRYHYIVERYLDPGADGVYGNSANGGGDGIVGTYDDPVDPANHPFQPHYLYRVVASEEIR